MSSKNPQSCLSKFDSSTEHALSVRRAIECGLKLVGKKPADWNAPILYIRRCLHCDLVFAILRSKAKEPGKGRFCAKSCSTKAWTSRKPKVFFQEVRHRGLAQWQTENRSWNVGVPMREISREKLSTKLKGRNLVPADRRGGNGTGMSPCEEMLASVLTPGWVWNYVIHTKPLRTTTPNLPTHYKPDFAWPDKMICLEVDGASHRTKLGQERDAKKEDALSRLGWTVLRISNEQVRSMFGI